MPKKPNYILKAGVVLHKPGTSKFYTLNNVPDEAAEEWLGEFPHDISNFETYPTDWESRVKARKDGTVHVPTTDELKDEVEKLNAELAEKETAIEAKDEKIAEVEAELSAAKEQLEAGKNKAQEEVERLNGVIAEKEAAIEAAAKEKEEAVAAAKKEVTDSMNKAAAESKKELLAAKDALTKKDAEIEKLKADLAAAKKAVPEKKESDKK